VRENPAASPLEIRPADEKILIGAPKNPARNRKKPLRDSQKSLPPTRKNQCAATEKIRRKPPEIPRAALHKTAGNRVPNTLADAKNPCLRARVGACSNPRLGNFLPKEALSKTRCR
jgi:hypothetical protein